MESFTFFLHSEKLILMVFIKRVMNIRNKAFSSLVRTIEHLKIKLKKKSTLIQLIYSQKYMKQNESYQVLSN